MRKNNVLLVALAIALGVAYVIWFTDWFKPRTVAIFHTSRNLRQSARYGTTLVFGVYHPVRMTELKVVPLDAYETNNAVLPVWHLVSDSNSEPVKIFFYGQHIPGMRPSISGERAEPLETNVMYRLLVTAGKIKGQHDFEVKE